MRYTEKLVGPAARVLNSVTGAVARSERFQLQSAATETLGRPQEKEHQVDFRKMNNHKNAGSQFGVRRLVAAFHSHAARSISSRHFSQWTGLGSPQPGRHRCDLLRDLIFSHCFDFGRLARWRNLSFSQRFSLRIIHRNQRPLKTPQDLSFNNVASVTPGHEKSSAQNLSFYQPFSTLHSPPLGHSMSKPQNLIFSHCFLFPLAPGNAVQTLTHSPLTTDHRPLPTLPRRPFHGNADARSSIRIPDAYKQARLYHRPSLRSLSELEPILPYSASSMASCFAQSHSKTRTASYCSGRGRLASTSPRTGSHPPNTSTSRPVPKSLIRRPSPLSIR